MNVSLTANKRNEYQQAPGLSRPILYRDRYMESDKVLACFLLHALGDTIGYKNGDWEFNYGKKKLSNMYTLELVYEFIELGGVTGINLEGWNISDDTILHLAIARSFLGEFES